MATTTFTTGTVVTKGWLNDADFLIYDIFSGISAVPSAGKIFRSTGTIVSPSTFTIPDTYVTGDILFASATNTLTALAKSNSAVLVTNGSGVPAWSTASSTFPYTLGVAQGGTGVATLGAAGNFPIASGATTVFAARFPFRGAFVINGKIALSVGSNALTVALKGLDDANPSASNPVFVMVPSITSNVFDGGYSVISVTGALSVVVSSGSTLGHTSAVASAVYVYLLNNAGTLELAVSSKFFGGATVQSSTAEGGAGASDSATVLYSTTARSNVATICLMRWKSTQTTAGTWTATTGEVQLYPFFFKIPKTTKITATGTFTKDWDTLYIEFKAKAGGGSGGGSATAAAKGGGGGSGEETVCRLDQSAVPASLTVTIPSAAAAIALNTNANGNTGGTVSVGSLLTAIGGAGGTSGDSGGAGGGGGSGGTGADDSSPGHYGQVGSLSDASKALNAAGGGEGGGAAGTGGNANSGGGGGSGSTGAASGAGGTGRVVAVEHYSEGT